MSEKQSIYRLIKSLKGLKVYDEYTWDKLELLTATPEESGDINQRERKVVGGVFGDFVRRVEDEGKIRFDSQAGSESGSVRSTTACEVTKFLGFGNTGPVYAVSVGGKPYALKLYSAARVKGMIQTHGNFGLGGILHDLESRDRPTVLSDLGKRVFSKKPKEIYGRCKRLVKIHDVGVDKDFMYVLMDLLDVDPISKIDPSELGAELIDVVSWAVDCCVALCQLHVEEARLHLNIRPEAFIRQTVKESSRLPKYSFFHYPKKYERPPGSRSLTTEFIMVDHLDNSIDIDDKNPKGLGTVGSWLFIPPEQILQLLKTLRSGYEAFVEKGLRSEEPVTIKLKRTQMDDVWALGLTFFQFLMGGKNPFGEPRNLADMVHSILLTRLDFSHIDPRLRPLIAAMLEKDPAKRFQGLLQGCPDKVRSRRSAAEAVLFKLEEIALGCGS